MLSLKTRLVILAFAVMFGHAWWWAATQSPEAMRVKAAQRGAQGCKSPKTVVAIRVSVSKYPENWRHIVDARHGRNTAPDGIHVVDNGLPWPTVLTKNDVGEKQRREAGLRMAGLPGRGRDGLARDEYPPAEGRSSNAADFKYVNARQNSAQGASMGGQLRRYCNGTRYKLVAAP